MFCVNKKYVLVQTRLCCQEQYIMYEKISDSAIYLFIFPTFPKKNRVNFILNVDENFSSFVEMFVYFTEK